MSDVRIEPHRIKSPIQLLAVWFAALALIVGTLTLAATKISSPPWVCPFLVISSVLLVAIFLLVAFLMQTKFRPHLQDDEHYSLWLERQDALFGDFAPENVTPLGSEPLPVPLDETWEQREQRRVGRYRAQEGVFLVHAWRPSHTPGQVADIVIWLHQHKAGPLDRGEVERVEYHLGPMFFKHPVVKTNAEEGFKLEVSAYYPMLCLARAFLKGRLEPIELELYVSFHVPLGGTPRASAPRSKA